MRKDRYEMRYCINCGSPMGDEKFCNQCGTDNGVPEVNTTVQTNPSVGAVNLSKIDVSFIAHAASVVLFAIASLVMLTVCCKQAENMTAQSMLYTGSAVFAAVYFAVGMWSCVPALLFLLNIKNNKSTSVAGAAIVIIIITIALCLINVIFAKFNGFIKFFGIMSGVYKSKAVTIILLEVLAAGLGLFAPRIAK